MSRAIFLMMGATERPPAFTNWGPVVNTHSGTLKTIRAAASFQGTIYAAGLEGTPSLVEWDGEEDWVQGAPYTWGNWTYTLAVFRGKLYRAVSSAMAGSGRLYEWNGVDAWVLRAMGVAIGGVAIYGLTVLNDTLYAVCDGALYAWNNVDEWVMVTPVSGGVPMRGLTVRHGAIFGGTIVGSYGGALRKWNGVDAWIDVAPNLGGLNQGIAGITTHKGRVYGVTISDKLYEWNSVDAWVEVAPSPSGGGLRNLTSYRGGLFGTTASGALLVWNNVDDWDVAIPGGSFGDGEEIGALVVHDARIYVGTSGALADGGKLYVAE